MPSFFDLQKFASTGIASPDMTAFDKARALAAFGGGAVQTLTDVPPLSFKANGKPLISWSMLGNGSQTGTPSPDNIIMPTFCGVRTGNLFDKNSDTINNNGVSRPGVDIPAGTYSIDNGTDHAVYYRVGYSGTAIQVNAGRKAENIVASDRLYVWRDNNVRQDGVMLNLGTTALPYEPYGWAEKITCAGQTTPIYLGEVPTVRRIKKLVLTGEETIGYSGNNNAPYKITVSDIIRVSDPYAILFVCSHYRAVSNAAPWASYPSCVTWSFSGGKSLRALNFRDKACADADAFKSYLASQYAAGTPVCVWYVLAEPTTGIVNEPLCKIGDYADELSSTDAGVSIPTAKGQNTLTVDTELPPSEMTITYKE